MKELLKNMKHSLIKAVSNGQGRAPRWIPFAQADTLRDIFSYYNSASAEFTQKNIYYTIGTTSNFEKKPSKEDILTTHCIPVDLDGFTSESDILECEVQVVEWLTEAKINDYITICSGNGLHLLISTGILPNNWLEKNKKAITYSIYSTIGSIAGIYGAKVDPKVLESSRILRVPYTINQKEGKGEKQCYIITDKWKGESQNIVQEIEKDTSDNSMEEHNVAFEEIVEEFTSIGAEWYKGSSYYKLRHPVRGSKNTITLYRNSKFFWSFSDKDDGRNKIQLCEMWEMYNSDKPCPFKMFATDNIGEIIAKILSKFFDFRYSEVNTSGHSLIYAITDKSGYTRKAKMSKPAFASQLRIHGVQHKIEQLGIVGVNVQNYWENVCAMYPSVYYDAVPIHAEIDEVKSKLFKILNNRFEMISPDFDDSRSRKTTLTNIIRSQNIDYLEALNIDMADGKVCIPYTTLLSISDKAMEFASTEREYVEILKWLGLNVSNKNGLICVLSHQKLLPYI